MSASLEQLTGDFFANPQTSSRIDTLAAELQAAGYANAAHFFRAVAASERIRMERIRGGLDHHAHHEEQYFICPYCGLIYIPEPPEVCPVDETPAANFIKVE
jgi:rubrerythrin